MEGPPIDRALLAHLKADLGGDDAVLEELIEIFLRDTARRMAALETAAADGVREALNREAHTLKSTSLQFGATTLYELGMTLEQDSAREMPADARERVARMRAEWERVRAELADMLP